MIKSQRINEIIAIFQKEYQSAKCTLDYLTPFQLLIATQLAAQCTDARVNIVTKILFIKYKSIQDFAQADPSEFEEDIKSTGFYRNKARNIIACCKRLIEHFDCIVPGNMDDLLSLPGVGRKTANLILGDVFKKPAIVIDTHATRLSNRLGFVKTKDAFKIEKALSKIVPEEKQTKFCHQLVYHGRSTCTARKPNCINCCITQLCPKII